MSALKKHLFYLFFSCWAPIPDVWLIQAANPALHYHRYLYEGPPQLSVLHTPAPPSSSHLPAERTIQLISLLVPEATLYGKQRGVTPADPLHPWHVLGLKYECPEMGPVCACAQVSTSLPLLPFGALCPKWLWGALSPWERHLSRIMCASQHKQQRSTSNLFPQKISFLFF